MGDKVLSKKDVDKDHVDHSFLEPVHELYNNARNSDKFKMIIPEVLKFYEGVEKSEKEIANFSDEIVHYENKNEEVKKSAEEGVKEIERLTELMAKSFGDFEKKLQTFDGKFKAKKLN